MHTPIEQIKRLLLAVFIRRRLFIAIAASVALIAVSATFFRTKVYEAKSTVFIERNVINNLLRGITVSPSVDDRIKVLRYHMLSRDMVSRTLKKMDMDTDERYNSPELFQMLVEKCQVNTNISIRGNDLFFVSIVDPDPAFAKEYINSLVNIYVEENLADKREESYGANRFLTEQVSFYKKKLDEADARIIDFRREKGIYSTVTEASLMAQIEEDEAALKSLRGEKTEKYATIKTINQQLAMLRDNSALISGALTDTEMVGNSTDSRIEQMQAKIEDLLLVYNEQYPAIVKLRDQIEELKKRQTLDSYAPVKNIETVTYNPIDDPIYVDLKMRLNTTQSDINALIAQERELTANIKANQELLRNFPEDKKRLNDLERERAMQASVYEQLLERVGVSEVSQQMEVADKATTFRIVDPAILPIEPVGQKRITLMFLGICVGLAAGLGAVLLAEYLDESIKEAEEIRSLGVTVLAEIPFIKNDEDSRRTRRKDLAAATFAGTCSLIIGGLLVHDLLMLSIIDRFIAN